jgi:hypothetical protein
MAVVQFEVGAGEQLNLRMRPATECDDSICFNHRLSLLTNNDSEDLKYCVERNTRISENLRHGREPAWCK